MRELNSVFSKKQNNQSLTSSASLDALDVKDNFFTSKIRHCVVLFALCLIILLTACKSLPEGNYVHPVDLLDDKSQFYLAVPKNADKDLIVRMVGKYIPELSEKDIKTIADRTDSIYCGISRSRKGSQIQAAIEGNIPLSFVPRILSKKNGWTKRSYLNEEHNLNHDIYTLNGIDISFTSSSIALIGRNIEYMIDTYDHLHMIPLESSVTVAPPVLATKSNRGQVAQIINDYLKGAESDIRFYANEPKSFLTLLTGTNLDLKLTEVSGSFRIDPNYNNQYLLDIYLNFREFKFLKAGRALLALAFGLTGADTQIEGESQLIINNIKIDKKQLYQILAI